MLAFKRLIVFWPGALAVSFIGRLQFDAKHSLVRNILKIVDAWQV